MFNIYIQNVSSASSHYTISNSYHFYCLSGEVVIPEIVYSVFNMYIERLDEPGTELGYSVQSRVSPTP